ncbi:MAG: hypothetical protein IPO83_17360 [Chitinophagaceae bacterium]|nr:hypothetical protein [Chitinophagaceae bacterium]
MKTLKCFLFATLFISATAFADSPKSSKVSIVAPIYEMFKDCDLTYYKTKINGESVLVDNKGRFVKYLCDDEETKNTRPVIFQVIMVPVTLFTGLK